MSIPKHMAADVEKIARHCERDVEWVMGRVLSQHRGCDTVTALSRYLTYGEGGRLLAESDGSASANRGDAVCDHSQT